MAVLPKASRAVTSTVIALPAVAEAGAVTWKVAAAAALTETVALPVIVLSTVSVALIDWLPAVTSVTEKLPAPSVSIESTGRLALRSVLVKCTVPL